MRIIAGELKGKKLLIPLDKSTRPLKDIISEIHQFFQIHRSEGTYPGGVHLEMTGQDVTECMGGLQEITDEDLQNRYHTYCDPRLNAKQSLELAFLLAELLVERRKKTNRDFSKVS